MTQRSFSELVLHHPPLHVDDTLDTAVRIVYDSDEPALPVVDERERYAGIFGEREFMEALFPGYLKQLRHAAFVDRSLDEALERRTSCRLDPVGRYMTPSTSMSVPTSRTRAWPRSSCTTGCSSCPSSAMAGFKGCSPGETSFARSRSASSAKPEGSARRQSRAAATVSTRCSKRSLGSVSLRSRSTRIIARSASWTRRARWPPPSARLAARVATRRPAPERARAGRHALDGLVQPASHRIALRMMSPTAAFGVALTVDVLPDERRQGARRAGVLRVDSGRHVREVTLTVARRNQRRRATARSSPVAHEPVDGLATLDDVAGVGADKVVARAAVESLAPAVCGVDHVVAASAAGRSRG